MILGEERAIYVCTPSGYTESLDSYPVMYVIDGVTGVNGRDFDADKIMMGGLDAINSFYKNLSERFGYVIYPDVGLLNSLGWGYVRDGKLEAV
jgi:hypothetical protein